VALPLETGEAAYLAALEAMHLDVAVVTPDAGEPRSYGIDSFSCVTPQYCATDIARRMNELLNNPELLSKLRIGGASTPLV
jgi:glycosyltransferase involved in cell wall biosynthesis